MIGLRRKGASPTTLVRAEDGSAKGWREKKMRKRERGEEKEKQQEQEFWRNYGEAAEGRTATWWLQTYLKTASRWLSVWPGANNTSQSMSLAFSGPSG